MRCTNNLRRFLGAFILFLLLSFVNRSYILELYNKRCVPYNVRIEKKGANYVIYWQTLVKCETYIRYKEQSDQDYKVRYPDSHFLFKYRADVPADEILPNFIVIVSNGKTYGVGF